MTGAFLKDNNTEQILFRVLQYYVKTSLSIGTANTFVMRNKQIWFHQVGLVWLDQRPRSRGRSIA